MIQIFLRLSQQPGRPAFSFSQDLYKRLIKKVIENCNQQEEDNNRRNYGTVQINHLLARNLKNFLLGPLCFKRVQATIEFEVRQGILPDTKPV